MTDDVFSEVDREALQRSLDLVLANDRDPGRIKQIKSKLLDCPWRECAELACYVRQIQALQLKPWEAAPSDLNPSDIPDILARGPTHRDFGAAQLAQRLIAAGRSIFEPDPITALAKEC